jgi:pimeloyl-ACP methyl ester carboxylesterase
LNVERLGASGHPILFLHGWGQSLEGLKPLGRLLAHEAQVHLVDLPGFGSSPAPPGDWGTEEYAHRVLAHLDESNLEVVDLLGHSFGGRIAVRLAVQWPRRVRGLVLVSSAGLPARRTIRQRSRAQLARALLHSTRRLKPLLGPGPEAWVVNRFGSRDYKAAGPLRGILVKTVREDLTALVSRITQPTLLLWGEEDKETPVEMGRRFNELIRGSRLIELPGFDHFPFLHEGAHVCAHHVMGFLRSLPERAGSTSRG